MFGHDDDDDLVDWKDDSFRFLRVGLALVDEYGPHVDPDSTAGIILMDVRLGLVTLFKQMVDNEERGALRSVTSLRESIASLLESG